MNQSNTTIYQLLDYQINNLLNEKFAKKLSLGKYSSWVLDLTAAQIIPMLSAIGEYGKAGIQCPDIDTRPILSGKCLDSLGIILPLNEEQQKALNFLGNYFWRQDKLSPPFDYSKRSPHFAENVNWAINLTSSDLFGIIWHLGGFGIRFPSYAKNSEKSINSYHYRAQECLICLMRVAQGQLTYYQLGGQRFPLREQNTNSHYE
ncbi:MAG: hypothetical protein F6K24_17955 [Okeania sp. SIO2D1]|nr:hypothetical protein [Okeania sp. SIO2D1]